MQVNVASSDIAKFLGRELIGPDLPINKPSDLRISGPGDLVWVRRVSDETVALLEERIPSLVICDQEVASRTKAPHIISKKPRLDFVKAVTRFFVEDQERLIHAKAAIDKNAIIGRNVHIGPFANIGPQVIIKDDCIIGSGVVIEGKTIIGRSCHIKPNSVIGAVGFGFEYDEDGTPLHFPHIGQVIIEDDVWLGSCTTVELAALGTTRICRGCKVDDLVQIGHNSTIGANTLIAANAVICGGAVLGERCWIAPNSVIKEHVSVGNGVTVGLGAVVLKDVADGLTVAGVPAKPLNRQA